MSDARVSIYCPGCEITKRFDGERCPEKTIRYFHTHWNRTREVIFGHGCPADACKGDVPADERNKTVASIYEAYKEA